MNSSIIVGAKWDIPSPQWSLSGPDCIAFPSSLFPLSLALAVNPRLEMLNLAEPIDYSLHRYFENELRNAETEGSQSWVIWCECPRESSQATNPDYFPGSVLISVLKDYGSCSSFDFMSNLFNTLSDFIWISQCLLFANKRNFNQSTNYKSTEGLQTFLADSLLCGLMFRFP